MLFSSHLFFSVLLFTFFFSLIWERIGVCRSVCRFSSRISAATFSLGLHHRGRRKKKLPAVFLFLNMTHRGIPSLSNWLSSVPILTTNQLLVLLGMEKVAGTPHRKIISVENRCFSSSPKINYCKTSISRLYWSFSTGIS